MAIRKFYSNKAKPGWDYDAEKEKYASWGFDIYLANGKRKRESGFPTRQLAECALSKLKTDELLEKYGLKTL